VAGQFHHRFGERVAILHSAFHGSERARRNGGAYAPAKRMVVGSRRGREFFAPVKNLGVDRGRRRTRRQLQATGHASLSRDADVAVVRARNAGRGSWFLVRLRPVWNRATNAGRGEKYTRARLAGAHRAPGPMPVVTLVDMRQEFLETRKQNTFSRALIDAVVGAPRQWRAIHAVAQPPRILEFRDMPFLRGAPWNARSAP